MNKANYLNKLMYLGTLAILLTFVACWDSNEDNPIPYFGQADRTVIGLILADNSLDSFFDSDTQKQFESDPDPDLDEIILGMENSSIDWDRNNVVLFVDDLSSAPCIINLRREKNNSNDYVIVKDTIFKYTEESIADIEDIHFAESSSTESMCKDALKRIITKFDAKSYGLILWSHGDGWIPSENYITPTVATRKFGQDTNTGTIPDIKWLENSELKSIIAYSCDLMAISEKKYEFIYADACEMANITTVYDFKDYCKYFIGSVAETPGYGGCYTTQLPAMFEVSNPALAVATAYNAYYNGSWHWTSNAGAQLSVIKTSGLDNLAAVTKEFLEKTEIAASIASINWSQMQYFDRGRQNNIAIYYDFQQVMESVLTSDQLETWNTALDGVIEKTFVPEKIYSGIAPGVFTANPCCGLAAYFPGACSNTKWNTYFQTYTWYEDAGMGNIQDEIY